MASERVQRRIDRLLDQIEAEADQENWERVCARAELILDFAPDNADAAAFLATGERVRAENSRLSIFSAVSIDFTVLPLNRHLSAAIGAG